MEHAYSMQGHTRSVSSLASTIMPVTSDASAFTSVTASPMEVHDPEELPIELKIPLPPSSHDSDEEVDTDTKVHTRALDPISVPVIKEDVHPKDKDLIPKGPLANAKGGPPPADVPGPSPISLEELAHLVELERYQRSRTFSIETDMDRLSLSCGLDRRLISTFSVAYGNLIDQYKTDDQAGFAGLYEACEQLKASCQTAGATICPAGPNMEQDTLRPEDLDRRSCVLMLPPEDQGVILTFLNRIRTEPNFLSDRISSMSPSERTALTSSYHPAGIDFSVLPNHSHGKTQFYSRDSQMMKLSRRMDNLHRFHNQDPLFALLYGVFDSSSRPGSSEHFRRTDIWSTTCARNFTEGFIEGKPGSDELVIAALDAFANFQDWSLKPKVETYLMKILAEGSFLLDLESSPAMTSNDPIETHNAKAAIAEADFFDKALTDLFGLLTTGSRNQAVPETALIFIHAILRKIEDQKHRIRAKHFILCRWYFATFISSIVVYPEVRGLLMTHHIGGAAREMILQKLVVRMQQRVFDVTLECNNGAFVKPEVRDGIMAIFRSFEPPPFDPRPPLQTPEWDENSPTRFLMLSPLDIVGLIQKLYPDRPLVPGSKESQELDVAPPSTAGSSTLNASASDADSALALSLAPSTSGTSTTSRTLVSEMLTDNAPAGKQDTQEPSVAYGKGPSRSDDFVKPGLPLLLNSICRRLTNLLGTRGTSDLDFSHTAWAFVYYSGDGMTLSFSPMELENGQGSESMDTTGDFEVLKTSIVKLLAQTDTSDFYDLVAPVGVQYAHASDQSDPLVDLMEASAHSARSGLDYGTAHFWWHTLGTYRNFLSSTESPTAHSSLLRDIADDVRRKSEAATHAGKASELRLRSLEKFQRYQTSVLTKMEEQRKALRVKMWYSSDVRNSATYEEALHVTRALRAMASSKRAKQPASTANWARQRLRGSGTFARPEVQTLEAMSAPKDYGGQSKLADEQIELTSRWLTRRSIENFCKGEERIHRFCFEIQKSIGKIVGPSPIKNPVLWSSNLFRREKASFDAQRLVSSAHTSSSMGFRTSPIPYEYGRLSSAVFHPSDPPVKAFGSPKAKPSSSSFGGFWNATQPSPAVTGLGLHDNYPLFPPTPTSPPRSWSSNPFTSTSPLQGTVSSPSCSNFGDRFSQINNEVENSPAKVGFADNIKTSLRSLLISDLGYLLWKYGSETDAWVNDCVTNQSDYGALENILGSGPPTEVAGRDTVAEFVSLQDESSNHAPSVDLNQIGAHSSLSGPHMDKSSSFAFSEAYAMLLQKMSLSPDPCVKLRLLYELEDLIIKSLQESSTVHHAANPANPRSKQRLSHGDPSIHGRSVPRTRATSLEEVIANCNERRAGTMRSKGRYSGGFTQLSSRLTPTVTHIPGTDDIVNAFISIFRDPKLRPLTLFRDLQYIAAFIPSETLDQTAQGKAFWDAGLAALALKEDLCESMIIRATQITAYHISSSKSTDFRTETIFTNTTLRDAANLWLVTAKEGSPAAARELGLFYLTHPELLPRVTMPFSKAKDVYKSVMSLDARTGDKEKGALDRSTFAVVFHWMEFAANGGDKDARDFLRGNGELSGGR